MGNIQKLDELVEQYQIAKLSSLPPVQRTLELARGMYELRTLFTEEFVNRTFMPLRGTKLGFRTDRDNEPRDKQYSWEIVRDCIIDCLLRGFYPINNELNVIGGNPYYTKEAFDRVVPDFEGLSQLEITRGVPQPGSDNTSLVPMRATWLLHGRPHALICELETAPGGVQIDRRIPVRVNSGMGVDAVLGKAHRKLLARVYERLTKWRFTVEGEDEGEVIETEADEAVAGDDPVANLIGRQASKAKADERVPGQKG